MKKIRRPAKAKKKPDTTPVAPKAADECDENISPVMKEIHTRLRATKFKDGCRFITKAELENDDLARAELDFRSIKTPEEAIRAVRYEYLREIQSAYLAVEAGLKLRRNTREDSNAINPGLSRVC